METTVIRISLDVKKMLDEMKIHHRETYDDILIRLIRYDDEPADEPGIGDGNGNK